MNSLAATLIAGLAPLFAPQEPAPTEDSFPPPREVLHEMLGDLCEVEWEYGVRKDGYGRIGRARGGIDDSDPLMAAWRAHLWGRIEPHFLAPEGFHWEDPSGREFLLLAQKNLHPLLQQVSIFSKRGGEWKIEELHRYEHEGKPAVDLRLEFPPFAQFPAEIYEVSFLRTDDGWKIYRFPLLMDGTSRYLWIWLDYLRDRCLEILDGKDAGATPDESREARLERLGEFCKTKMRLPEGEEPSAEEWTKGVAQFAKLLEATRAMWPRSELLENERTDETWRLQLRYGFTEERWWHSDEPLRFPYTIEVTRFPDGKWRFSKLPVPLEE